MFSGDSRLGTALADRTNRKSDNQSGTSSASSQRENSFAIILLILAGGYLMAQLLADIASLKLIDVFGRTVDAGTLIYPVTFTLRDLIHKLAGKTVARSLIALAAIINIAMALFFGLVAWLEPTPETGGEMWGDVLGPVWRIVFASIIAEVLSELLDTEVYSRWVAKFGSRNQWGRVLSSNVAAIPLDSLVFGLIAFVGLESAAVITDIVLLNIAFKGAATLLTIPLIYAIRSDRFVE